MGATATLQPDQDDSLEIVRQLTHGKLVDLVVEAVGHRDQAFNQCIDLCREHGTILYFGVPPTTIDGVFWRRLFWKNISVVTSVGPDFDIDFPLAMRWIAERRLDVTPLITHRFPLAKIQDAFETFVDRRDGALKVFVEFRGALLRRFTTENTEGTRRNTESELSAFAPCFSVFLCVLRGGIFS